MLARWFVLRVPSPGPAQRGWTALCYAARYGKTEAARALIKHRADVNAATETPEAVRERRRAGATPR